MSKKQPAQPQPIRKTLFRNWFVTAMAVLVILAIAMLGLALSRPASYDVRAVDYALLPTDKQSLAEIVQSVADCLRAGQPAEILLDQEQVNRWITARHELWPAEQLPQITGIEGPLVRFLGDDQIEIAAMTRGRLVNFVFSMQGVVSLETEGITLKPIRIRVGQLPIAITVLNQIVSGSEHLLGGRNGAMRFVAHRTGVWPNGRFAYEVSELGVSSGCVRIVLKPLAP